MVLQLLIPHQFSISTPISSFAKVVPTQNKIQQFVLFQASHLHFHYRGPAPLTYRNKLCGPGSRSDPEEFHRSKITLATK